MKGKHLFLKVIILFIFLFLFSIPSLALIPGDFGSADNGPPDGVVDFEDLMIFALAYGTTPADANWNPLCDVYPDDKIDFEDLMIFAMHYGEFLVHNLTKGTYYNTIQTALDDADSDNTIEVADGIYNESIVFPSGKKVILQSVNGASLTIIRGNDGSNTLTLNNSSEGTTLEGFTITHTNGLTGRGIFIYNGNLTINNCTISGNSADWGSGIGICNNSTLTITGSTISGNSAGSGGGIYNYTNSTLTITGSTISGNSAGDSGGGIANCDNSTLTITGSTISGNSTYIHGGGGIFNYAYSTLTITGSIISSNSAGDDGGGISNCDNSTLTITGSTISGNSAEYNGGGIYIALNSGTITIGGSSNTDTGNFNEFTNNYKTGSLPSPDQHIRDSNGDCHEDYPYNYFTPDNTGTYSLRDIGPAGGLIFYDKGSYSDGWRYLEAAPVSTEWTGKQWGSFGILIGGTGTGIGTGQSNTTTIVTWLNSHSETNRAAQVCDALVYGGYSDWFLPSRDELSPMYTNLKLFGVGGFIDSKLYWSSSENDADGAWGLGFDGGNQANGSKDSNVPVRAVRAF